MQRTLLRILPLLLLLSCAGNHRPPPVAHYQKPDYEKVSIVPTADTLRFPLDEDSFGDLESWSIRQRNGETVIAFFDQRSESILEYQYPSCRLINKILLRKIFKPYTLHDAYLQSYDSIYVLSKTKFSLVDSAMHVLGEIPNVVDGVILEPDISPIHPPVAKNGKIYLSRYSTVNAASLEDVRKWENLWAGKPREGTVTTAYGMPGMYLRDYYNYPLHRSSYCINDDGNFVFSFAADTMLYETDLDHLHNAWFAKSKFQTMPIPVAPKDSMRKARMSARLYNQSDSYGGIYFDPYHKRYLRIARSGTTREEFEKTNSFKPMRFLILDKQFRIIGESEIPSDINVKQVFFVPDGRMYARILPKSETELLFIRLEYQTRHAANRSHEK